MIRPLTHPRFTETAGPPDVQPGCASALLDERPPRGGRPRPETQEIRVLAVGADDRTASDLDRITREECAQLGQEPDYTSALDALREQPWDLLALPLGADAEGQLRWWTDALRTVPSAPRIVALVPKPSLALEAAAVGIADIVSLPVRHDSFRDVLARWRVATHESVRALADMGGPDWGAYGIVSGSPVMVPVFQAIAQVAPTPATVLVQGASGTGKELVARAIHRLSPRAREPFIALNCAAIPEPLLESEIFGHEKGAFTGASERRSGRFERASGGTLFLDEIGDMSLALQCKILRAIQEREIERVGSSQALAVDVRLIAAVNRDLLALVRDGRFREDLYYRLAVVAIQLPQLADRGGDLELLTAHFLRSFGERYGKAFSGISDQAIELLRGHEWVGNIRELSNVIERAVVVAPGDVLRAEDLPACWRAYAPSVGGAPRGFATLAEVEQVHIREALHEARGHVGNAAKSLGIHRNTLTRKLRRAESPRVGSIRERPRQ